jgi:hypothetical protein
VYAVHAWLGLVTGAFLLLLSLTGTVLVFADELDRALNPALLRVTPRAERATYDAMLAAVRARHPDASIVAFRALPERPDEAYTVSMRVGGRFWFAHVDPYTARGVTRRSAGLSARSSSSAKTSTVPVRLSRRRNAPVTSPSHACTAYTRRAALARAPRGDGARGVAVSAAGAEAIGPRPL